MTTIAYRDGILAADTSVWDRGCYVGQVTKIFAAPCGLIGGVSGDLGDSVALRDWLLAGAENDPPEFKHDDSEGVLIHPTGKVEWAGSKRRRVEIVSDFYALGSGFRIAFGAMAAGASAVRAVEICCDLDDGTRLPITVMLKSS